MVLNEDEFDMTPGWRKPPRPGVAQQGRLFHGGNKPAQQNWPRGYSPERRRDIEENLGPTYIQSEKGVAQHPFFPPAIRQRAAELETEGSLPGMGLTHAMHTAGRHAIIDALARSSVKARSLDKPTTIFRPPDPHLLGSYQNYDKIVSLHAPQVGPQTTPSKYMEEMQKNFPGQFGDEEYRAEGTLLHEVGHHHSATWRSGYVRSSSRRTPAEQGEEEAYADAYMATHQRRHPLDPRPEATARAYNFGDVPNESFDEPWESRRAYQHAVPVFMNQMRPTQHGPMSPAPGSKEARRAWQEHERGPEVDYSRAGTPTPIFGRDADVNQTRNTPDYGQWGYFRNDTEGGTQYLDVLRVGTPPVPQARSKWNKGKVIE